MSADYFEIEGGDEDNVWETSARRLGLATIDQAKKDILILYGRLAQRKEITKGMVDDCEWSYEFICNVAQENGFYFPLKNDMGIIISRVRIMLQELESSGVKIKYGDWRTRKSRKKKVVIK